MMMPVTAIVKTPGIQPRGGFIPPEEMSVDLLCGDNTPEYSKLVDLCYKLGNLSPQTMGLVFDYLLRTKIDINSGVPAEEAILNAFNISIAGAGMANREKEARDLVSKLAALYKDDAKNCKKIVQAATELVSFDTMFRSGCYDDNLRKVKINNEVKDAIQVMLLATERYLADNEEELTALGFKVLGLGSKNVAPSDGDLLSVDSVIDIKCLSKEPTSQHTMQLLLYYILGMHELPEYFCSIKYIKILNPRLGKIYSYEISKIDDTTLKHIEKDIIGYKDSDSVFGNG